MGGFQFLERGDAVMAKLQALFTAGAGISVHLKRSVLISCPVFQAISIDRILLDLREKADVPQIS